jgi:hypothetical protein
MSPVRTRQEGSRLPNREVQWFHPPYAVMLRHEASRSPCLPNRLATAHRSPKGVVSTGVARPRYRPRGCDVSLGCACTPRSPVAGDAEIPPAVGMTSERGCGFDEGWPETGSLHCGRDDTRERVVERGQVDGMDQENEKLSAGTPVRPGRDASLRGRRENSCFPEVTLPIRGQAMDGVRVHGLHPIIVQARLQLRGGTPAWVGPGRSIGRGWLDGGWRRPRREVVLPRSLTGAGSWRDPHRGGGGPRHRGWGE